MSFRKHRRDSESGGSCPFSLSEPLSIRIRGRAKLTGPSKQRMCLRVVRIYLNGFAKGFDRSTLISQIVTKEKFFAAFIVATRFWIIGFANSIYICVTCDRRLPRVWRFRIGENIRDFCR